MPIIEAVYITVPLLAKSIIISLPPTMASRLNQGNSDTRYKGQGAGCKKNEDKR
jgi:hypothetical protein